MKKLLLSNEQCPQCGGPMEILAQQIYKVCLACVEVSEKSERRQRNQKTKRLLDTRATRTCVIQCDQTSQTEPMTGAYRKSLTPTDGGLAVEIWVTDILDRKKMIGIRDVNGQCWKVINESGYLETTGTLEPVSDLGV